MNPNIITRSTLPRVVDLSDWRRRYESVRREETGQPVPHVASPAKTLFLREKAIEASLREYGKAHSLSGVEIAASIACALRWFRNGSSAAKAIEQGQKRAREQAWGTARPVPPKGPDAA